MDDMIYLLTGAAGKLGGSVARKLVAEGKAVRALVLPGDPAADRVPPEVEVVVGDIRDRASLARLFDAPRGRDFAVIHCASIVTASPNYSVKIYDVNVGGTKNVVDLCVERGVRKLVYVSSTGAIPELPRGNAIVEVERYDPDAVVGFYSRTKAWASQIVLDAARERGLDASVVCPSGIAGPEDYAYGPVASVIIDCAKGNLRVGVAGSFNAADVRDLAAGVVACCEKGRKGESYVLANECLSVRQLFRLVSAASGCKEVRAILPVGLAKAMAAVSELVAKSTGTSSRLSSFAVYNLARNNVFVSAKAKRELGYTCRPFAETIADTVAWLKSEGKL